MYDDIFTQMLNIPDVDVDIKEEEITPEGPALGEDTGIANMLSNLIKDEYEAIDGYNSFKASLSSHEDFIKVIDDITAEEMTHIGQLQTLLKQISPNASGIEEGEIEAEEQLDNI